MAKMDDWYYQYDDDWLSIHPDPMLDDESEDELRILEWNGDSDWGELILIPICLECGSALTGYSAVFKFRFCEVC